MGDSLAGFLWIIMPLSVALGASLITAVLVHARAEVAMARQREALVQTQALVLKQRQAMEERLEAVWETARREAFDEFLGDVRVEERTLATDRNAAGVIQRVCFREIPLTPWIAVGASVAVPRRLTTVLDVAVATCPSPASGPRSGTGKLHKSAG
jgi:hypothetical protein